MRAIIPIWSAMTMLTLGYSWTVGQSSLVQTNRNLCELWNAVSPIPYTGCEFHYVLVGLWVTAFLATAAIFVHRSTKWIRVTALPHGGIRPLCKHCYSVVAAQTKQGLVRVEPRRLITVGIIGAFIFGSIALIGLVIDSRHPQASSEKSPPIASNTVTEPVSQTVTTDSPSSSRMPSKGDIQKAIAALTPQDKGRLSDVLFEISRTLDASKALNDAAWQVAILRDSIANGSQIDGPKAVESLKQVEAETDAYIAKLYQVMNNRYFQSITTYVVADASNSGQLAAVGIAAKRYREVFDAWMTRAANGISDDPAMLVLLRSPQADFQAAYQGFAQYVAECRQRLSIAQDALK